MNLNKVFILGRLTADPQLRTTPTGQQVASFGVATNRIWTDKISGKREQVEFHNIVVWGRQAEVAQKFLGRGGLVLIEGRIQTRSWDDKQGQKRKTTEVVAERIQLGPRPASSPQFKDVKLPVNEIPVVNLEEDTSNAVDIKPEDLPF